MLTSLLVFSVTRIDGIIQLSHTYLHIGSNNIGSRSYCSKVEINALAWQQEKPKLKSKIPTIVVNLRENRRLAQFFLFARGVYVK